MEASAQFLNYRRSHSPGEDMGPVIEEYHSYAGVKARLLDELAMEGFDVGTVLWMARRYGWIHPNAEIELPSPTPSLNMARSRA